MRVITIGRSSQNDVPINDGKVSRHHCQIIQHDDGSFSLSDFGSTNGTYVNGQRIFGEVRLNPNDVVRIGSNTLQWRRYFNSVDSPIYPQKKSSYLPIILGGVGGVLVLVVIALLLILRNDDNNTIIQQQHSPVQHQFSIDGVNFGFDMTLEDIRQENNVYVTKHEVESNENDDAAAYYYQGYDYYIVNNNTVVTINEETQNVKFFCTRSKNYYTSRNIHVGSTWSELENAYPNLNFYTDFLYFNYFSHAIEEAVIATDQNSCISFIFFTNQFTKTQIDAIMAASNPSDFDTDIDVSAISISVLQSIRSSIVIEQIEVWDCNYTNTKTVSNLTPLSSSTTKKTLPEQKNEKQYSMSKQEFYLKFKDNESYTLSDGTTLNASLTTMGIGDLWLKISWQGKTPLKIIWELNCYGLAPTSGELYAVKSYDTYSIHKTISDFQWVQPSADVYGVKLTVCPISENERKYAR